MTSFSCAASSCPVPLSADEQRIFLSAGIAAVLSMGLIIIGQSLPHKHPTALLELLKQSQFEPKDQAVIDFVIVMLNPNPAKSITEVRALISHAKKLMAELEGDFESVYKAITKFEELASDF